MSTDYYFVSPSHKRAAQFGSSGLGGTTVRDVHKPDCLQFLRWVIDESVQDVVIMYEEELYALQDRDGWSSEDDADEDDDTPSPSSQVRGQ